MGALPKNKITRVERGKRRAGNRPSLTKQLAHAQVPNHKQGFVAQLFRTLGVELRPAAKTKKSAASSKTK